MWIMWDVSDRMSPNAPNYSVLFFTCPSLVMF